MTPETKVKLTFIIDAIDNLIEEGWAPRSVLHRVMEEYTQEYYPEKTSNSVFDPMPDKPVTSDPLFDSTPNIPESDNPKGDND